MKVKSESEVAQSCPTLSDPMDCSPPGSSALRGLQETRVATREESGVLGFPSRRGLTPRGPRTWGCMKEACVVEGFDA